jgi:hypothetical protein
VRETQALYTPYWDLRVIVLKSGRGYYAMEVERSQSRGAAYEIWILAALCGMKLSEIPELINLSLRYTPSLAMRLF